MVNNKNFIYGYSNIIKFINDSINANNKKSIPQQIISNIKKKKHSLSGDDSHLPQHLREGLEGCKLIGSNSKDIRIQANDNENDTADDSLSKESLMNQCNKFMTLRNSMYNKRDPSKKFMSHNESNNISSKADNVIIENKKSNNNNPNNMSSLIDDDEMLKGHFESHESTNFDNLDMNYNEMDPNDIS